MNKYVSDIAFTNTVKQIQEDKGSRDNYARMEQGKGWNSEVTQELTEFLYERDSFYMATVNSDGQPYIQHRGGPTGFLKVIDNKTLGFGDYKGNRQYISFGNLQDNNKICLFFMDYPNRKRIKLWGTGEVIENDEDLIDKVTVPEYKSKPERVFLIYVEAWDINCPQHIVPRFTKTQIQDLEDCPCCEPV